MGGPRKTQATNPVQELEGCVQGVANGRWVETEEAFVNGSGSTGRTPWWWHGMGRIQTWIAHSAPVNGAGANYVMWRAA